ncbi:hypothetical protein [Aureimonas sp. ME7]|uniref:hypothetical protein n=1 Tax=Aureimonas sp. ME7 TaxID=2744252 RepID=UPI0015F60325|nr:hypothetical protein [Aureimonas sp. ME7]
MLVRALIGILAAILGHSVALAQEWRGAGSKESARAFYVQSGRPAGIQFECVDASRVRTVVAGNGARFSSDREATLVLSVDGTARVSSVRAEDEPGGGGSRFVRIDRGADLAAFVASLKRGHKLEVSSPAGSMRLSLAGSSRALSTLEAGCLKR